MEDMVEVRKYQNIADRLARLMKSPKNIQNLQKSEKINIQSKKQKNQNLWKLRKTEAKNQFKFSDISNLINDFTHIQSMKMVKSHDKLKRILNKNVKKQKMTVQDENLHQSNKQIDKVFYFKNSQSRNFQNQTTKIVQCLQFGQQSILTKRQISNNLLINSKLQNQTKRPKFQFQKVILQKDFERNSKSQQQKQKIFGKARHGQHKSTSDFSRLGKVKSQTKFKIPMFEHIITDQSVDQFNGIQKTFRYNTFQQDYKLQKNNFKLERNRSDFHRAPGRIFKNK